MERKVKMRYLVTHSILLYARFLEGVLYTIWQNTSPGNGRGAIYSLSFFAGDQVMNSTCVWVALVGVPIAIGILVGPITVLRTLEAWKDVGYEAVPYIPGTG